MGIGDDLIARVRVNLDGQLIGQRARRNEKTVFLTEEGSRFFDELVDARVLPERFVAHLGLGDGLTHCLRGARCGVASHIDEWTGQSINLPASGPRLRESDVKHSVCCNVLSREYICILASDLPNYRPVIYRLSQSSRTPRD